MDGSPLWVGGQSIHYRERPRSRPPSYPNWQRKRIQNPCSVSSNLTEGTRKDQLKSHFGFPQQPSEATPPSHVGHRTAHADTPGLQVHLADPQRGGPAEPSARSSRAARTSLRNRPDALLDSRGERQAPAPSMPEAGSVLRQPATAGDAPHSHRRVQRLLPDLGHRVPAACGAAPVAAAGGATRHAGRSFGSARRMARRSSSPTPSPGAAR